MAVGGRMRLRELFSAPVTGWDSERHIPVWRKVSTLAWRNWGINDVGYAPRASTTRWLERSGSQCNLVSDTSLCVFNLRWHSVGWSPTKSMTELITHVHQGLRGDKHNQLGWYMFQLPTRTFAQDVWDRKDKLISCDGWPDCYEERKAFKPYCMNTITWGCCGKLLPGARRAWPR